MYDLHFLTILYSLHLNTFVLFVIYLKFIFSVYNDVVFFFISLFFFISYFNLILFFIFYFTLLFYFIFYFTLLFFFYFTLLFIFFFFTINVNKIKLYKKKFNPILFIYFYKPHCNT